jgi:outer membrane protein, multidrug efflux system
MERLRVVKARLRPYIFPILLFLAGCMVGPDYVPPEIPMPDSFQTEGPDLSSEEEMAGWWRQFQDPLLSWMIEEAIRANFDLRIALEKIEETRAQYRIERSHLWPEIDLNATAARTRISQNLIPKPAGVPQTQTLFPTYLNTYQVGFDAIWELDFWGKFRRSKNAAFALWEASWEDYHSMLISTVSEVAVNYVGVRALQAKISLNRRHVETDKNAFDAEKGLYDVGINSEINSNSLLSQLETDKASLLVLETSLNQTIFTLAYLLDKTPEEMTCILETPGPIPSGSQRIPIGLPSDLLRRRPDVRSAERSLAAATDQIGVAIADYFPHVALTGLNLGSGNRIGSNFGWESNKADNLFTMPSRMFSVGVGISWDLIDFGRVSATVDVNKAKAREALLTYKQTAISALKDVESALVAYFNEEMRRDSLFSKAQADHRNFLITQRLYDVGLSNILDLLNAENTWIASQTTYVESEQSLTGDLIAVYKALGGDWLDTYCP